MNSLSDKIQKSLITTMLAVTMLFLAIGIPIQLGMSRNSVELICFSLDVIAQRENDSFANELFEQRRAAIRLRVREILEVDKVLGVAVYDRDGELLESASNEVSLVAELPGSQRASTGYLYTETAEGLTFVKPIRAMGETLGWVRIVYDMSAIVRQTTVYYVFFAGLLFLSLGCVFLMMRWRMRRFVISPLKTFVTAMENARTHDLVTPVAINNPASEIAGMVNAYNDMASRLHASYKELDLKKAELEEALSDKANQAAALEASELRYRTIVTQAPVGIFTFDNNGVVLDANEFFATVMGAPSSSHIVGIDMLNDIADPVILGVVRSALDTGTGEYEGRYTSISGNKNVYIRARLLRINEQILCGVFEDLTEHKDTLEALSESEERLADLNRSLEDTVEERTRALTQQAEELKRANERLKELDAMKTAFLSSVSHELRTPLTSILGFTKVTLKQFEKHVQPLISEAPKVREKGEAIASNLVIVSKEGERLSRLVNDVLDLARIESGRMPWNDVMISPTEVLENVVSASEVDFHDSGLTLRTDIEPDITPISIDPDKLFQVVRNLLHNAVKFTTRGSVTVSARQTDGEDAVEIRVTDTGPGIHGDEIDTIFDKFHQLSDSGESGDKPKGSGLGLAICRQIVEHYAGTIRVESERGKGASFIIRLPMQSAASTG